MLIKIDERYRWDKYANYNCEPYVTRRYPDLETAKFACIKDRKCDAIALDDCNPFLVLGLCIENEINREYHQNRCIYKKGDIHEYVCIFIP